MIVHIVLGKAREDLVDAERAELVGAMASLATLPGIEGFSSGVNFSERSRGYTHGAVMEFAGREALQGYLQHPRHLEIVAVLNRLMPERVVVDYETESSGISA